LAVDFSSIVSVWVELSQLSQGWYVMAKDNLGVRHAVGAPHGTLETALAAARYLLSQLT
jgi:hypothetical protein